MNNKTTVLLIACNIISLTLSILLAFYIFIYQNKQFKTKHIEAESVHIKSPDGSNIITLSSDKEKAQIQIKNIKQDLTIELSTSSELLQIRASDTTSHPNFLLTQPPNLPTTLEINNKNHAIFKIGTPLNETEITSIKGHTQFTMSNYKKDPSYSILSFHVAQDYTKLHSLNRTDGVDSILSYDSARTHKDGFKGATMRISTREDSLTHSNTHDIETIVGSRHKDKIKPVQTKTDSTPSIIQE